MLKARDVTLSLDGRLVLDRVSLDVGPGQRIGIVGPNGIGKTTLLRVLAGEIEPDTGTVERAPATLSVGYLPQESAAAEGEALLGYLARRTGIAAASAALDHATAALTAEAATIDAHAVALERFLALGGDDLEIRAAEVAADLGLPADRMEVDIADLSGGQRARAGLAAILLSRFDVLLLDEPTNDLDFAGLERLERFVHESPGAIVVVSHDRAFLDATVDRILEIQEETHRAVEYAGAWSDFVAARELARSQQYRAYEKHRAERRDLVERARTQRAWSDAGRRRVKRSGETDKHLRHRKMQRSEQQAAKARITEKALERHERRAVEKPWEGWNLNLALAPASRSGDVVARLEQAVVRRGAFVLGPLDVEIGWQERVALVGPNGSGKTTLLRVLLGELPLASGRRTLGPRVVVGVLDQARDLFPGAPSVLVGAMDATRLSFSDARSLLAKFGLTAAHVERPPDALSPGERTRALLATLMARGVNLLVLDEPTNHLDLPAIEQLEVALAGYDGTLIVVSHDRRFLDAVHVTRTIRLG